MKKAYKYIAACAALAGIVGCAKIEVVPVVKADAEVVEEEGNYSVTFDCRMPEDDATKTFFNSEKGISWAKGDKIRYCQYATVESEAKMKATSYWEVTSVRATLPTLTISSFNTPDEGTEAKYFSVYPYDAYKAYAINDGKILPRITLPESQTPTETSFDPKADILISKCATDIEVNSDNKYPVLLQYARPSAFGKMTITNLPSSNNVASIKFSAKQSGSSVNLAGSHYYDLEDATMSSYTTSVTNATVLTLDYKDLELSASSSMTAYFCCYPFELAKGDSFKVVVTTTAGEVFTKNVTIPASLTQGFKFESGKGTQFTVNMASANKSGASWLNVDTYTYSSYTTYGTLYFGIAGSEISSACYKIVSTADFDAENIETEMSSETTDLTSEEITTINNGTTKSKYQSSLTLNTEYTIIVKATNTSDETAYAYGVSKTAWFGVKVVKTTTASKVNGYFYGEDLASLKYKWVKTSDLSDVSDYEEYFDGLSTTDGASKLSDINNAKTLGKGYSFTLTSGTEYIFMAKATNTSGETKFAYSAKVTPN